MNGETIRTLIIEASASVGNLATLVKSADENIKILSEIGSVETAVKWLKAHPAPDLIFQNIHLMDDSSFRIFDEVHVATPIVFIADCGDHAIEAFKVNAVDYLVEPINSPKLKLAIERAKESGLIRRHTLVNDMGQNQLTFSLGTDHKTIDMGKIAYIHTESKITLLVTASNRKHPMDYAMNQVEQLVDSQQFFRINRQFIINRKAIKEMLTHSKSRVKILLEPSPNVEPIVSSDRMPIFRKWLVGEPVD